jgi:hypothetical protein
MPESNGRAERILDASRAVGETSRRLADELGGAARGLDLSEQLQAHPLRTVAIAAGVGYLLGGGLFSPLTRRLVKVGMRALVVPLITRQVEALAEGAAMAAAGQRH